MEFHPAKCQQMSFSRKREPARLPLYLHGTAIPKADSIKYLGVTIDSKVNWNAHVISTAAKGHLSLGFVRRNILTTSEQVKSTAYKQLVRPVLEYASASWDSASDTEFAASLRTQRSAQTCCV